MGDKKFALEMASPLNNNLARLGQGDKPATVVPQQMAFPVKTVWRVPIPLIRRIFGRTQVYRVVTQVTVYPPDGNGGLDIDRAVVCMTMHRNKKPFGLKGAMKDDWDEVWDAIEIMQKVNPKMIQVSGNRALPPYEK